MNPRYAAIAERAGHRREYCQAPEAIFNCVFEVEHILPPGRGGTDDDSNLALSCRGCNLHKSDYVDGEDSQSGKLVTLFNPRLDKWEEHFVLNEATGELIGLTSAGRATVDRLQMNRKVQLTARNQWMRLRLFPRP